jgi:hypothetical protein
MLSCSVFVHHFFWSLSKSKSCVHLWGRNKFEPIEENKFLVQVCTCSLSSFYLSIRWKKKCGCQIGGKSRKIYQRSKFGSSHRLFHFAILVYSFVMKTLRASVIPCNVWWVPNSSMAMKLSSGESHFTHRYILGTLHHSFMWGLNIWTSHKGQFCC